jgi:hypothetical protein
VCAVAADDSVGEVIVREVATPVREAVRDSAAIFTAPGLTRSARTIDAGAWAEAISASRAVGPGALTTEQARWLDQIDEAARSSRTPRQVTDQDRRVLDGFVRGLYGE